MRFDRSGFCGTRRSQQSVGIADQRLKAGAAGGGAIGLPRLRKPRKGRLRLL
jgi:hypothetical protein